MDTIVFNIEAIETRQGELTLSGIAAPFERYGRVGSRKEKIKRGAFSRSLDEVKSETRDITLLVDHNPEKLLARTRTGSLTLAETDKGLRFNARLADTQLGRDIKRMSDDNLLSGVSIGFKPRGKSSRIGQQIDTSADEIPMMRPSPDSGQLDGSSWIQGRNAEDGSEWSVLTEIDLQEVSVLTGNNPAYPDTSVRDNKQLSRMCAIYEII